MGIYANIGKNTIAKAINCYDSITLTAKEYQKYKKQNPDLDYLITRAEDHEESQKNFHNGWVLWVTKKQKKQKANTKNKKPEMFFNPLG